MFSQTGVIKPNLDVGTMKDLSASYTKLASGLSNAHADAEGAVAHILSANDGPAAQQFSSSEQGAGSIAHHLGELAEAATRTATAYDEGANAGGRATFAMEIRARDRELQYWNAIFKGADQSAIAAFVQLVRIELLRLESAGAAAVQAAFAGLALPSEHQLQGDDYYGSLDEGIKERLAKLAEEDPEKLRELYQKIADEFADQNGIPRKKIQWVELDGAYGMRDGKGNIQLDPEYLASDPSILLNTIVHEMEHSRQYEGMGWRWPWDNDKGNMSDEEAERWRELNSDYVRSKGDNPDTDDNEGYWPRPVEVGARNAGRDFINNLTEEELEKYL